VNTQAVGEEKYLRVKAPRGHILIEIGQVRVLCYRLVERHAFQPLTDHFHQGGFAYTDVSRDRDEFFHNILSKVKCVLRERTLNPANRQDWRWIFLLQQPNLPLRRTSTGLRQPVSSYPVLIITLRLIARLRASIKASAREKVLIGSY
jgi:hypothetical protein